MSGVAPRVTLSSTRVDRALQLRATADEEIRTRAEAVILNLLLPLPRMAERLLNRLYFLLVVAWSRNLSTLIYLGADIPTRTVAPEP